MRNYYYIFLDNNNIKTNYDKCKFCSKKKLIYGNVQQIDLTLITTVYFNNNL